MLRSDDVLNGIPLYFTVEDRLSTLFTTGGVARDDWMYKGGCRERKVEEGMKGCLAGGSEVLHRDKKYDSSFQIENEERN